MDLIKVGFTGTQVGMTDAQKTSIVKQLTRWAKQHSSLEAHHGDCVGADADFHNICLANWPHELQVVLHPPIIPHKRSFCQSEGQINLPQKDYISRNHDIVDAVDCMIATPKETTMQWRGSGTWATIRYSQKISKPLRLFYPDGKTHL